MSSLQLKPLAVLGALVVLLAYHSPPASAQGAPASGTQGSSGALVARTYAQMGEQRGNSSALSRPARAEQKAVWGDVVISHQIGGCGLACRAGHID
jgi:hypothetical protein